MNSYKILSMKKLLLSIASVALLSLSANAQKVTITVDAGHPDHAISPTLFGVFFEDINLSADGGVYRELVRNISFEDTDSLSSWTFSSKESKAQVVNADKGGNTRAMPLNFSNRQFLSINAQGVFSLSNNGYWGISLKKGETYDFKMALRTDANASFGSPLTVKLSDADGKTLASGTISNIKQEWNYSNLSLKPTADCHNARLEISGDGKGRLFIDMVTLMPRSSWGKSGLRTDLGEAMNALKPSFFRFPGGCWVEGNSLSERYQWKKTVGPLDIRVPLWNLWGYKATHGLGFHEYLQLAEDLGAEPLFCINAGVAHQDAVGFEFLDQWIQDALDAIEYANGPVTSVWGAARARNGHPEPFGLKYLEIGNENYGTIYFDNYRRMANAIHARYPEMQLVSNDWGGSHPMDPTPELIDEHYYDKPDWFIFNATRYDKQPRSATKIFVGEYAANSMVGGGNLRGAVGEAAFMTGLERNSDHVAMAAYAPLLCNVKGKRWPVNLINFDNHRWYGLPSYYVQQMFAANQGTDNLPLEIKGGPSLEIPTGSGSFGLGTWKNTAEFKDVVVTDKKGKVLYKSDFENDIKSAEKSGMGQWSCENGVLRQSSYATGVTAFFGDTKWSEYVITLKARRLDGENGFQIYFHHAPGSRARLRWDVGGYSNSVCEMNTFVGTRGLPFSVEAGRWYDVRLEVSTRLVRGYLDGKLIQEFSVDELNTKAICASAATDSKSGDIIVKVVNTSEKPVPASIRLNGIDGRSGNVEAILLTSEKGTDENTLDNPTKVSPKQYTTVIKNNNLSEKLAANSVYVFRIKK